MVSKILVHIVDKILLHCVSLQNDRKRFLFKKSLVRLKTGNHLLSKSNIKLDITEHKWYENRLSLGTLFCSLYFFLSQDTGIVDKFSYFYPTSSFCALGNPYLHKIP